MRNFVKSVFTAYAVTYVVTSSSLFKPVREKIKEEAPNLRIKDSPHPIECRMCFGFWASLAVCLITKKPKQTLAVYGASYFLATQER